MCINDSRESVFHFIEAVVAWLTLIRMWVSDPTPQNSGCKHDRSSPMRLCYVCMCIIWVYYCPRRFSPLMIFVLNIFLGICKKTKNKTPTGLLDASVLRCPVFALVFRFLGPSSVKGMSSRRLPEGLTPPQRLSPAVSVASAFSQRSRGWRWSLAFRWLLSAFTGTTWSCSE